MFYDPYEVHRRWSVFCLGKSPWLRQLPYKDWVLIKCILGLLTLQVGLWQTLVTLFLRFN